MTTRTTPGQAREIGRKLMGAWLENSGGSDVEEASLALESLAAQVEALTQNLDGHKTQAAEDFELIMSLTSERNSLWAELDKLKQQEPVGMAVLDQWGPQEWDKSWRSTVASNYGLAHHRKFKTGDHIQLYLAPGAQPAEIEALRADDLSRKWEEAAGHWMQKAHEGSNALRRLKWLHTIGEGNPDKGGYEWGVFRVKFDVNGKVAECWQTNSDSSDLDAAIDAAKAAS